jgi:purine-binding chemotaxis protein CheW
MMGMTNEERVRVVVFRLGEHQYVIDAAQVQELIRRPETLLTLPGAPEPVVGLVQRRGRLAPVVDLRRKLGLSPGPITVESCVILMRLPVGLVGVLADGASELRWAERRAFEPPSPVVTGVDDRFIKALAKVGDRLEVMLDMERLLTPEGWQAVAAAVVDQDRDARTPEGQGEAETVRADVRLLVAFELSGELYGVPVVETSEVRPLLPCTPLPNAPGHVRGLINLHGVVMPMVDLRRQLNARSDAADGIGATLGGLPSDDAGATVDGQPSDDAGATAGGQPRGAAPTPSAAGGPSAARLIVLKGPGYPVALWADVVHGLWRLPRAGFRPAPAHLGPDEGCYAEAVTHVDGRLLVELNVGRLLAGTSPAGSAGATLSDRPGRLSS